MSLGKIFDIAGSALAAQTLRLNVTASNLANAESVSSSVDQTYRARHPVFSAVLDGELGKQSSTASVQVLGVVESQAPLERRYLPEHPMADSDGFVYMPNVNPVEEMANMMSASRAYQNNVEVMNTTKELLLRTLTLGQ